MLIGDLHPWVPRCPWPPFHGTSFEALWTMALHFLHDFLQQRQQMDVVAFNAAISAAATWIDVFPIRKWHVPSKTPENHQKIWFRCSWFWTSEWLSVWCYMFFCLERMVVLPMKIVVLGPQLEFLSWRFSTSSSDCCKPNAINLLFAGGWFENNPLLVGWGWSMAACDMCWFQLSKNPKMEDNHPSRVGSA